MKNMTLRNIADACGGTYVGNEAAKDMEIAGAVIDSRLVEKDYLFIPIRGERVDGHRMYLKRERWQFCQKRSFPIRRDHIF